LNKFIIKEENNQLRLDKALANQTELSRSLLTELIHDGKVLVNGEVKKAKYKVKTGDRIDVEIPKDEVLDIVAEDLPLEIVYEDLQVAVVNKPQGMVVHPAAGHASGTLVNALMYHIKDLSSINGVIRPGIVHRIDKDTSGLLMVAKNDKAHESLAAQLKDKSSKRRYLAIVHGEIPNDKGTIEAPIGRNPKERKKQAVVSGGKPAITHFEVLERFLGYTLVALRLETGRTHQIRVHMNYIGHPVAGDPLYGPNKTLTPNHGQFLHAETLGFEHPTTGEFMEFQAEVPEIFAEQLKKLRGQVE
jgi:23S rRNA pseudouridine1911/1915/1917 synthase